MPKIVSSGAPGKLVFLHFFLCGCGGGRGGGGGKRKCTLIKTFAKMREEKAPSQHRCNHPGAPQETYFLGWPYIHYPFLSTLVTSDIDYLLVDYQGVSAQNGGEEPRPHRDSQLDAGLHGAGRGRRLLRLQVSNSCLLN